MPKNYRTEAAALAKNKELDEKTKEELQAYAKMGFDVSSFEQTPERPRDAEMLNFNGLNWYRINQYPSMGKWYPEGTVVYGKPLSLLDIKLLATMQKFNEDDITRAVIARNIYIPSMPDVNDVFVQDKLFFVFWLRQQTFADNVYTMSYECPDCNTKMPIRLELSNMNIKAVPDDLVDSLTLRTGQTLKISATRTSDQLRIEKIIQSNNEERSGMDEYMLRAFNMVKFIDDEPASIPRVKSLIEGDVMNFGRLLNLCYMMDDWGPDTTFKGTCTNCGRLTNVSITFPGDFYLPNSLE